MLDAWPTVAVAKRPRGKEAAPFGYVWIEYGGEPMLCSVRYLRAEPKPGPAADQAERHMCARDL